MDTSSQGWEIGAEAVEKKLSKHQEGRPRLYSVSSPLEDKPPCRSPRL